MDAEINQQHSDEHSASDIQLAALQYADIEETILSATRNKTQVSYAVRVSADAHSEYGRLGLFEVGSHRQQPCASDYATLVRLPLFEAWPLFPNSLLSTEVAVSTPCASSIDIAQPVIGKYADENESDHQCTSHLYYNLHKPLPGYLGKQLYRSGTQVVAFMHKEGELELLKSSLAYKVLTQLTRSQSVNRASRNVVFTQALEYNGAKGGRLRTSVTNGFQTECYRLTHICHRLHVISKASLVLCNSSGMAVDAIRANVPVAFVSHVPQGFNGIQQCVESFLNHGSLQRLITDQTHAFSDMLFERSIHCHVMSGQKSLQALINHRMTEFDRRHARYEATPFIGRKFLDPEIWSNEFSTTQQDLILHTQQSLCVEPERAVKLKTGLESGRRKFQKFRESPVRFMEDSQNRLLRSLVTNKPS